MIKRVLFILSLSLLPALAGAEENWVAGEHYDVITPAEHTADPGKVEVAEFFWYGCPHCFQFEPELDKWKETLPSYAYFRGIPAMWGGNMELHARAFYTAQALGALDTVGPALFKALNVDRKKLDSEESIRDVFVAQGVSAEDFDRTFNSFGIGSQVRQASAAARGARLTGTPSLMVNGKYLISPRKAGGYPNMLKIADYLIKKEEAAAASKTATN